MASMNDQDRTQPTQALSFGPFRLSPAQRLLERNGVPIAIGSRSLDILIALAARSGQTVSKRDLLSCVWPDTVVDDSSLRVHVAGLRKALGDVEGSSRYVANVPGRGYSLVAPTAPDGDASSCPVPAAPALPRRLARMIGRDATVLALRSELMRRRFVTLVGPGGVGKTTVAIAVAHAALADFDAVWFVGLEALEDSASVNYALAAALGVLTELSDPLDEVVTVLRDKRCLIILDNCEHVVGGAAVLAEELFSRAAQLHILTTSRETLRAEGEHVYRLPPLSFPPRNTLITDAEMQAFPAVQLFMERAVAGGSYLDPCEMDASVVADICGRLDGVPLAIEIAASRLGMYGLEGIIALLESELSLHWQGRRTVKRRHQTLETLFDWSYNLLTEVEQRTFRRLSVFQDTFTLEAARAVAADVESEGVALALAIEGLAAKSLLMTVAIPGKSRRFRLFEITRVYALAKLARSGEENIVRKLCREVAPTQRRS
jgi:predicted ATPase/DNA-binding winged helix-turn-helix (wHTH) protein